MKFNINVKIFYNLIKKIEPHSLKSMGFFCNYTHRLNKFDGVGGLVFKENKEGLSKDDHHD